MSNLNRFYLILLLAAGLAACGVIPDRRPDNSSADFKQSTWIGNFNLQLLKVETPAALTVTPASVQFMSKDNDANLILSSNASTSWTLSPNLQTATHFEFPIASSQSKDVFINGNDFLLVEKVFQMGQMAGQTVDSLQSLSFDVMKFAKNLENMNAKASVRVLYFVNKEIVFTIDSELHLVAFSGMNATIQKFPVPAIVTNQIKLAKNLSAGLSRNSHNDRVLWVQIEESLYFASSSDESEYHWRGPYKLFVNGAPPGRTVTFDQTFPDAIEDAFKEMTVLREDGIYTVQAVTPVSSFSDGTPGTSNQDPKTFFETNLKASFQTSCTNCHASFSDYNTVTGEKRQTIAQHLQESSMPPSGTDESKNLTPEMRGLMASWLRSLP